MSHIKPLVVWALLPAFLLLGSGCGQHQDPLAQAKMDLYHKRYDAAVTAITTAPPEIQNTFDAQRYLAEAYLGKKEYDKSIAACERAAALDPKRPEPYLAMASVEIDRIRTAKSEKESASALMRAIDDCQKALTADPKSSEAYALLARMREGNREVDEAIKALEKAIELDPKNGLRKVDLARLYVRHNEPAKATQLIDAILAADPGVSEARVLRARLLATTRKEDAKKELRTALADKALKPETEAEALYLLSQLCVETGESEEARKLSDVLYKKYEPYRFGALNIKAILLLQDRKWKEAYDALKKLERSDDPGIVMRLAYAEENIGMPNQAISHYQLVTEKLDPKNIPAHLSLARLMLVRGLFEDAMKHCDAVLMERPADADALRYKAKLYQLPSSPYHDYEKARVCFQKMLARNPNSTTLRLDLADLYLDMGRPREAIDEARAAVGADVQDPRVRLIEGRSFLLLHLMEPGKDHLEKAIQNLKQAQALAPANPSVVQWLANAYVTSGKPQAAVDVLEPYLSRNPAAGRAYIALAGVYERMNLIRKAVDTLEKASKVNGIEDFDIATLARAYFLATRRAEALEIWQKLLIENQDRRADFTVNLGMAITLALDGQYDKAVTQADTLVRQQVTNHLSAIAAACIAIQAGQFDKATRFLESGEYPSRKEKDAYVRFPELCRKAGDKGKKAAALVSEGLLHALFQSIDTAAARLNEAAELLPNSIVPPYVLGSTMARANRVGDLIAVYRKIFEKFPADGFPHFQLAMLTSSVISPAELRQQIELAVDLDPELAVAHITLAQLLLNESQADPKAVLIESAVKHANEALKFDPNSMASLEIAARAYSTLAQLRRNAILEEPDPDIRRTKGALAQESSDQARKMLRTLQDKFPNSVQAIKARIQFEIAERNFPQAAGLANSAVQSTRWDDPDLRLLFILALQEYDLEEALKQARELVRQNPASVTALRQLANIYIRMQQPDWALGILQQIFRMDPANLSTAFDLARACLKYGRPADAKTIFAGILNSIPADASNAGVKAVRTNATLGLAKSLTDITAKDDTERSNNLAEAANRLKDLTEPPTGEKADERGLVLLGRVMELQKRFLKAEQLYKQAAELNPKFPTAYYALALLQYRQGQYDAAISLYTGKIIPTWQYDVSSYARLALVYVARNGPNDAQNAAALTEKVMDFLARSAQPGRTAADALEAYYRAVRITALIAARRFTDARAEIQRARDVDPALRDSYTRVVDVCTSDPAKRQAFVASHGAALFFHISGEIADAIEAARKAADAVPQNLYLLGELTDFYQRNNDFENAAATQEKAIDAAEQSGVNLQRQEHEKLYTTLIDTYLRKLATRSKTALESALKASRRGLTKWPRSVDLLTRLAAIQIAQDLNTEAAKTYAQIVEIATEGTPSWLEAKKAFAMTSFTLTRVQDAADACDQMEKYIQADAEWLNNSAWFHATAPQPDFPKAVALAEKAKTLSPASPNVRDTLGWIYYLVGNYVKAEPELEFAAQEMPYDPNVLYHLGATQATLSKAEEALKNLLRAMELHRAAPRLINADACKTLIDRLKAQLAGAKPTGGPLP